MTGRPNRTSDPPPARRGRATGTGRTMGAGRTGERQLQRGPAASPTEVRPDTEVRPEGYYPAGPLPGPAHDEDAPVYVISIAAQLAGMHPQTLRSYDRLGLVTPGRTAGRGRRYSARDVALLREVQRLSQEEGVNLEGVKQILRLSAQVMALQAQVRQLTEELARSRADADRAVAEAHASHRRDLVPVDRGALVVWRPLPRR
ncbi:putative transcriptional regulator [Frankia casuarinae]|uniref:Transcriptional regulator, MerR family n=1 Tax=Frankia casuarinae (strain DSM 45818 / CECT 9043 / HFP020203 / CcI3) TaxID=106370 RepID=Q2J4U1_FRACC|nr:MULTISPECIES: helix-turn-helix transcriptional regulator [Frankia]ABD13701.1 transcriptional regulator, MerR family [Frankia casuarinae]EYT93099.1 putative transcriptional regulator [Frankia casuarinae]KDA43189.1 putative transcriptional regulator [Frankia sp. BMG5.23]TFE33978.1 MerR family transcriptional regulator [Frankia sp. B2]